MDSIKVDGPSGQLGFWDEIHPTGPPFRDARGRLSGGNPGNSGGKRGRSGRPSKKARLRKMIQEIRSRQQCDE
jgi:hypothetical protein